MMEGNDKIEDKEEGCPMRYDVTSEFKKLEEVGFATLGLKVEVSYSECMYNLFCSDDPTEKYTNITLSLINHWFDEEDNEHTEDIGVAYGFRLRTFDEVSGSLLNYMDVIDSIDQDTYNCLSVFMDDDLQFDENLMFDSFFYLNRIIISEKYRGFGFGSILLEYIKLRYSDISTAIVLQPAAFEQKEAEEGVFEAESKRLSKFYERHGFKCFCEKTWIYHDI